MNNNARNTKYNNKKYLFSYFVYLQKKGGSFFEGSLIIWNICILLAINDAALQNK